MKAHEQAMLKCAGNMADIAGLLVGESLHHSNPPAVHVMDLGRALLLLKEAVSVYNQSVIDAVRHEAEAPK